MGTEGAAGTRKEQLPAAPAGKSSQHQEIPAVGAQGCQGDPKGDGGPEIPARAKGFRVCGAVRGPSDTLRAPSLPRPCIWAAFGLDLGWIIPFLVPSPSMVQVHLPEDGGDTSVTPSEPPSPSIPSLWARSHPQPQGSWTGTLQGRFPSTEIPNFLTKWAGLRNPGHCPHPLRHLVVG